MQKKRVIVVGSGFGGSVFACRLAESGRFQVHVLERGRHYDRNGFPRRPDELREAFWDPESGRFGMFEYQSFAGTQIDVLTASGLGGGSLIYSSVLYRMPHEFFRGWPGGITRDVLERRYDDALSMLEARPYPVDQPAWPYAQTPKTNVLARAARAIALEPLGKAALELEYPPLAVSFGPEPGAPRRNRHGVEQTACTMCGECNIGCNIRSKNTLDLNYLHRAREAGARIETLAEVRRIAPRAGGGYVVTYGDPRIPDDEQEAHSDIVVVSAGSLGTTRLLLGMKRDGHLPGLGPSLGRSWSPNGDLLGFCVAGPEPVHPTKGPVITSSVRFHNGPYPDGFPHGLYVQDGGLPNVLAWFIAAGTAGTGARFARLRGYLNYLLGVLGMRSEVNIGDDLGPTLFPGGSLVGHTLPMLGMGRDRSTGTLSLSKGSPPELRLDWKDAGSEVHYDRMRDAMRRLCEAMGGTFVENVLSLLTKYISVHPVGGCPMGDSAEDGVVSARTGEVFGHPGLFVADGSVLPTSIGPNPSLTIAALAEMFAQELCR